MSYSDDEIDAKNKRKKGKEEGDGKGGKPTVHDSAKNASPVNAAWIKKGESFKIFQKYADSVPTLNGKSICLKYHVKGSCSFGDSCKRADSHTNKFDDDTKKKFDSWVKMCRGDQDKDEESA